MNLRVVLLPVALSYSLPLFAQQSYRFQDPSVPGEERITDLLAHMTVEEKISALSTNPSVPRLGVRGSGHAEGLHGLALGGPGAWEGRGLPVVPTTTFPQSRGLGQTWDPVLLQQAASEEGYEVRFAAQKYQRSVLVMRAPNADLGRDPRWGRSEESYGEDPFLVGTMAAAFSRGLQGSDLKYWMSASLLKHFLANSNEDGRGSSSSNFDERLFREYYSVPFRMAIQEGHANAMMTAYNAWNGTPMILNPVNRDVVIKEWGFDGILCTDGGALTNLVKDYKAFKTLPEAAAATIHAGINQYLDDYKKPVTEALAQGLITEQELERNLRGVYRVMLKLGELDPNEVQPYAKIGYADLAKGDPWNSAISKGLARRVTDESIVLLKNQGALLPLDARRLRSIAVIGPLADKVALDWYSGTPPFTITPLAGIRARAGAGVDVSYADGSDLAKAVALAHAADVALVIIGNHPTCNAGWNQCPVPSDGKEAVDRKTLTLEQEDLARAVFAANPKTVVVLQTSFPYTTNWTQEHVPAILEMAHNSEEQGDGLADVLFGDYNPAGRLTQTWVANMDQLPPMMDYDLRHGRTYLYLQSKPLYAFGYGLSYTHFAYRNLRLSSSSLDAKGEVTVRVDVENAGTRAGDEVVQLYVSYPRSTIARPIEELKAFDRVAIRAGEVKTVELKVKAEQLAYWNDAQKRFMVEAGLLELRVGASSDDIRLRKMINVTGN